MCVPLQPTAHLFAFSGEDDLVAFLPPDPKPASPWDVVAQIARVVNNRRIFIFF